MNKSELARLVELDEQIRKGFYPTLSGFSEEYGVSERTIRRDLDFIRDSLKAPLAVHHARRGYYYTKDWEFPPIIIKATNRACLIFQLSKHLKALSSSDRQYVIDQVTKPPPPPAPPSSQNGLMSFSTGMLSVPLRPSGKFADLIAQIRDLKQDERRLLLVILR